MDSGREESIDTVKNAIKENIRWIDGVVFSGGEPALQREPLVDLAGYTKKMGRGVMVDTNGSVPGVIEDMLAEGLVDRISLDLKSSPEILNNLLFLLASLSWSNQTILAHHFFFNLLFINPRSW